MSNTNFTNTVMGDVSLTTNAIATTFREATNLNARVESNRRMVGTAKFNANSCTNSHKQIVFCLV